MGLRQKSEMSGVIAFQEYWDSRHLAPRVGQSEAMSENGIWCKNFENYEAC